MYNFKIISQEHATSDFVLRRNIMVFSIDTKQNTPQKTVTLLLANAMRSVLCLDFGQTSGLCLRLKPDVNEIQTDWPGLLIMETDDPTTGENIPSIRPNTWFADVSHGVFPTMTSFWQSFWMKHISDCASIF